MKKLLFLISLISFSLLGCNKDKCTDNFSTHQLKVNGQELDIYYTVIKGTTNIINQVNMTSLGHPNYIVIDDQYKEELAGQTKEFTFIGKINGQVVLEVDFTFRADDCHVYKISGPDEVTI